VGLNTTALGWTLCGVLLAAGPSGGLVFARPWSAAQAAVEPLRDVGRSEHDQPELVTEATPLTFNAAADCVQHTTRGWADLALKAFSRDVG